MSLFDDTLKAISKTRKAVREAVPKSKADAASALGQMGDIRRAINLMEAEMEASISALRKQYEEQASPHLEKYNGLEDALVIYAEANREALTENGKRQSCDLGSGELEWRKLPPSVKLRGVDEIISSIQDLATEDAEYAPMLRVKTEINKQAMLANPEKASLVPGVTISSEGEVIKVLPLVEELGAAQEVKKNRAKKAA